MQKTALLASDMDGTVIPLETGVERDQEIASFNNLITENPHLALAYVTGRHLELGLAGVDRYKLPSPDIFVCDVGTTIYFRDDQNHWKRDNDYRAKLKESWQGHTGADIGIMLVDLGGVLTPQELEKQEEFKYSYYLDLTNDLDKTLAAINSRLAGHGISANIIYSVDPLKKIGLIDILPPEAAKDYALSYLWQKLSLSKEKVVYAGDSGNDLLAFVSGFNAIVVANTPETVKSAVRHKAREKNIEKHIYFADNRYVQGVMDGCKHFDLF